MDESKVSVHRGYALLVFRVEGYETNYRSKQIYAFDVPRDSSRTLIDVLEGGMHISCVFAGENHEMDRKSSAQSRRPG